MQASELPEYRRIRAEGRWKEATAFRDAERLRLREAGRTRQQACDESWLLMLKKFPPVAKGSVRAAGRVEPARLGLPWQDRSGRSGFGRGARSHASGGRPAPSYGQARFFWRRPV